MVTVSMLKILGELLVDIHGQHDNQSLLKTESHIEFLDSFIGEDFGVIKQKYLIKYDQLKSLTVELNNLLGNPEERARKIDLLEFQINEILSASLKIGEDEEGDKKRLELVNAEKVASVLSNSYEIMTGSTKESSVSLSLNNIIRELNQISFLDEKYINAVKQLEEMSYQLDEISRDVRIWRDEVEYNPQLLERIEERLDLIARLKRKYGKDIQNILFYNDKMEREFEQLKNSEEKVEQLTKEISKKKDELLLLAREISVKRKEFAEKLETKIEKELEELEMKNTRFIVKIDYEEAGIDNMPQFNRSGFDKVEFLSSPNLGEEPKPLAKIASGGEMSRIMLAIKTILAKVDKKSTLIFDEIDTGISGKSAHAVGEKLAYIANGHQVICVTHLAHIAAMADIHFNIEKLIDGARTHTRVTMLSAEDEDKAIARILGGANISDITMKLANEMKINADKIKEHIRGRD